MPAPDSGSAGVSHLRSSREEVCDDYAHEVDFNFLIPPPNSGLPTDISFDEAMDDEEFCLDMIDNLPNNLKAILRFATERRPGERRYYQCDFHPYPCECEEYYYPTDDDESENGDESETVWSFYKDEGETHGTQKLEAVEHPAKREEDATCDSAQQEEEKKDNSDTMDEELSVAPTQTIHCYMTLVKAVRGVSDTTAAGQPLAAPNARKEYSEFPGSVLWIENPDAYAYDYKQIFGRCCDGSVTSVVVEDSYIAVDEQQSKNFRNFCTMLAENCPALETLELWTPTDPRKQLELFFKELRDNHKISVIYKKYKQHPRRYRFSNGWTVLADRGLGIYGGSSSDNDFGSNPTFFVYCPPGTPFSAKNAFQCAMWEDKWHMKALDEGTSACLFYHPTEYCDDYPNCPVGAMKCRKAHHFCSRASHREYCSCPPDEQDPQLNHRHAPRNVKR